MVCKGKAETVFPPKENTLYCYCYYKGNIAYVKNSKNRYKGKVKIYYSEDNLY